MSMFGRDACYSLPSNNFVDKHVDWEMEVLENEQLHLAEKEIPGYQHV